MNPANRLYLIINEIDELCDSSSDEQKLQARDVFDVFSRASAILKTCIETHNEEEELAIADLEDTFDEISDERSEQMRSTLNNLINQIATNMDTVNVKVSMYETQINNIIENHKRRLQRELGKLESRNKETFEMTLQKQKQAETSLQAKLDSMIANDESILNKELTKVSAQYESAMQEAEVRQERLEKQLQEAIHRKHEQADLKKADIKQEERRTAAKHEQISRDYQQKKRDSEIAIAQMKDDIIRLRKEAQEEGGNANLRLQHMIEALEHKNLTVINQKKTQLRALTQTEMELNKQLSELKLTHEKEILSVQNSIASEKHNLEERITSEKRETLVIMEKQRQEAETEFHKKFEELSAEITNMESKRVIFADKCNKRFREEGMGAEADLVQVKKRAQDREQRLRKELELHRDDLDNVKQRMSKDLIERQHGSQKNMGSVMVTYDRNAKNKIEQINEILRQFDFQQRKLTDLQSATLRARDVKKATELKALKQEHEARQKQLLKEIEEKAQRDYEETLKQKQAEEEAKHTGSCESINDRIRQAKGRIELIEMKLDGFEEITKSRVEQIKQEQHEKRVQEEEVKKELAKMELNKIKEATAKTTEEASVIGAQMRTILHEADDLREDLVKMMNTFEGKITKIEANFAQSKRYTSIKAQRADMRMGQLHNEIKKQNRKIEELERVVKEKESEIAAVEQQMTENKTKIGDQVRNECQLEMETVREDTAQFEEEMQDLKLEFEEEMLLLQEQLRAAKESTGRVIAYCQQVRDQALNETRNQINIESEERTKFYREEFNSRMETLKESLNFAHKEHQIQMKKIADEAEETLVGNRQAFEQHMNDLLIEKEEVLGDGETLSEQIVEVQQRECPGCTRLKEKIRVMLDKREELQDLIDEQRADQKVNEGKMNVIFNVANLQPPPNPLAVLHTNPPKIPRSICCQKNSYIQATPRSTISCAPVAKSCPIVQTSQVLRPRTAIPVVRL